MKLVTAPLWGLFIFIFFVSFQPQLIAGIDDLSTEEEVLSTPKKRKIIKRKVRRRIERQREASDHEEEELTEIPPPHEELNGELRPKGVLHRILRRISRTQADTTMMPQTDWAESHDTYKTIRHFNTYVQENNRQYDAPDPRSQKSRVKHKKRNRNPE